MYVVDSNDRERVDEAFAELENVINGTVPLPCICSLRSLFFKKKACPPPLLCFRPTSTDPELENAALLVLCNKQDLPGAMSTPEITDRLKAIKVPPQIKWHVQATCATTGDGLEEGLEWMTAVMTGKPTADAAAAAAKARRHA